MMIIIVCVAGKSSFLSAQIINIFFYFVRREDVKGVVASTKKLKFIIILNVCEKYPTDNFIRFITTSIKTN